MAGVQTFLVFFLHFFCVPLLHTNGSLDVGGLSTGGLCD